jgi:hypothetical protein
MKGKVKIYLDYQASVMLSTSMDHEMSMRNA